MDLRQQKTKRSIVNAFLALRSEKPLEKITVRELSERAVIHKATFYLHYHDIYELSELLECEVIDDILAGLSDPTALLNDTERFNEELYCLLRAHEGLLSILFSGSRAEMLAVRLEKQLKEYIFHLRPDYRDDLERNVILTYLIQGGYHAYMQYRHMDTKQILLMINTMAGAVLRMYRAEPEAVQTEGQEEEQDEGQIPAMNS